MEPPGSKTYRVEHREHGRVQSLGQLSGVALHHASLEVYVGELIRRGARGLLVLIDESTGDVVARRRVHPSVSDPRDRFLALRRVASRAGIHVDTLQHWVAEADAPPAK